MRWVSCKKRPPEIFRRTPPFYITDGGIESGLLFAARAALARAVRAAFAMDALAGLRSASRSATPARLELRVHCIGSGKGRSDGRQQDQEFFHV